MDKTITDEYNINDLITVMQNRINELTIQNILLETKLLKFKENEEQIDLDSNTE
jgi:hypothetical protein